MTVLLFLPRSQLARRIGRALASTDTKLLTAETAAECAELARTNSTAGIVVDSDALLFSDTLALTTFLRMENPQATVFLIGRHLNLRQRLNLFEAGADDYVPEPFFASELAVRLRHVIELRRAAGDFAAAHEVSILRCGDLELDLVRRKVMRSGKLIDLRAKEFLLLEYLVRNANRPVTREMILRKVWHQSFDGLTNVVDVYINALRNKLDRDFTQKIIQTNRGVGYTVVTFP
jgi:DNA-binding response OmpR family regulator